jgi:hypothetical protein
MVKIVTFQKWFQHTHSTSNPTSHDRMTIQMFKEIYKGAPLPPAEHSNYSAPAGFMLWRTERGDVMAVREE